MNIKKLTISALIVANVLSVTAFAVTHTVKKGDTLWKISNSYEVGLSEIKSANTQIKNYDLIYPGEKVNIPQINESVSSYEAEVIRLVNEIRKKNGLNELQTDWQLSRVARYKSEDMKKITIFHIQVQPTVHHLI